MASTKNWKAMAAPSRAVTVTAWGRGRGRGRRRGRYDRRAGGRGRVDSAVAACPFAAVRWSTRAA